MKSAVFTPIFGILFSFSCTDEGELVEYLKVVSVDPLPNSVEVDKAKAISIRFDRPVHISQAGKIQVRYVNDTASVNSIIGQGLTPPEVEVLYTGPFIWKPGRTVEVVIPQELNDPEDHTLRAPFSYMFTIAADVGPFQFLDSEPRTGNTVSIGPDSSLIGHLTFSDYLPFPDTYLTITAPAEIAIDGIIAVDGRNAPSKVLYFTVWKLKPGSTYTITIPKSIQDFEGELLSQDHEVVFHTRP